MTSRTLFLTEPLYDYLLKHSLREPEIMTELREETQKLPYGKGQIAPEQGQFMALLCKLIGAKTVIEIGTFTGYSALWLTSALPEEGQLLTCDINEEWTSIAQKYWQKAGLAHKIKLYLAPALETLDNLINEQESNTFDLIFIDADKRNYHHYYERALQLIRPGGLVLLDNVLWHGQVADLNMNNKSTAALRELNSFIRNDERVDISLVPIGDGMLLARKKENC